MGKRASCIGFQMYPQENGNERWTYYDDKNSSKTIEKSPKIKLYIYSLTENAFKCVGNNCDILFLTSNSLQGS